MDLGHVGECLEDQEIDPTLDQRLGLFAENGSGFLGGSRSVGFYPDAKRSDCARYIGAVAGRFTCESRPARVYLMNPVFQPIGGQLGAIRPVSIRFQDVGPGLDVFTMETQHQLGTREVQLVVAAIDVDSP